MADAKGKTLYLWAVGLRESQMARYATSDTYDSFIVAAPTASLARECAKVYEPHYGKDWLDERLSYCLRVGKTNARQAFAAASERPEDFLRGLQSPEGCVVLLGSFNGA